MRILRGWRKATDLRAYPSDYGTETLFADIDQAGQKVSLMLTSLLSFIVWWGFLTGHVVNNIMGFGS
jgi:hypothetical protein